MMPDLTGKTAVVTGGATGLGKGFALALAQAGADVAIHYHNSRKPALSLVENLSSLGIRAIAVQADFSSPTDILQCFDTIANQMACPDILVNNASLFFQKPLSETSTREFHDMLQVNLIAVHAACRAVLPAMRKKGWGRIVNIGLATAGCVRAYREIAPHAISKTGLLILTKSLAVEEAKYGVTVNCISPGLMDNGNTDSNVLAWQRDKVPMQRSGVFDDLRGAFFYLLGPADYVTGADIVVSGAWGL